MPSITAPPTSGPSATPSPLTPDQMPSASPRFATGVAVLSSVRLSGSDDAGAEPLDRAGGDQRAGARGERGGGGREGEDGEPDEERAPAAEAVAERGAGEQEDGEASV